MIKKVIGITTLLFLTVFLIMPVYADEPNPFIKTTDVFPGDLDYRNSLVDWNGYNLEIVIYWSKAGGLPPDLVGIYAYKNNVLSFINNTWDLIDPVESMYKLRLSKDQENQIKTTLFSRFIETGTYIIFHTGTNDTDPFLAEIRLEFNSLLNIDFSSIYISDALLQSHTGLLSGFAKTIDLVGQENAIGGGKADFIMQRITLDTESTQPIGTGTIIWQRANYNFISKYTGVKKIYYNIVISGNSYDPSTARINYYISQIGFFATTQTILPDLEIDTDFQIYQPTICGFLDIACISRNLIGELSNTVYNRLGADNIASQIMTIYDTIFYPVYIIDNVAWQNTVLAIYTILVVGVVILIVKRVS